MPFELRHLRYVIAAAEEGSFRRAAMLLGVRESAVSRRIRDLEDELGSALFIRQYDGVRPTYAGEIYVRRIQRALKHISQAEKLVGAIGRGECGIVRVGIFSSLASGFIADLVAAYGAVNSGVRLDFFEGEPSDHLTAIRRHQLDVAFLTCPPKPEGYDMAHLWNERVYVVAPEGDKVALQEVVDWEELHARHFLVTEAAPGPEIYDYLVKHLAKLSHRPSIEWQAVYRDTLMQIVASGRGLTLTSEATVATHFPGVVYRPLADEILPFCAIWSPLNDNPALRRLLSLARRRSAEIRKCAMRNDGAEPACRR